MEQRDDVCAGKPPLYFQHDGHSRTVIGIERYKPTGGKGKRRAECNTTCSSEGYLYNLLLLDPSHKTKDLVAAFDTSKGWQVCVSPYSWFPFCLQFCLLHTQNARPACAYNSSCRQLFQL